MLIVLYVVSALLLLIGIYFAIVHPFVCIIECALSKQLSGAKKALWIVATLITGSLAATFYTLFATRSTRLRRWSLRAFSTGLVCFAVATCIFYADPSAQELASQFSIGNSNSPDFVMNGTFDNMNESLEEFEADMAELEQTMLETDSFEVANEENGISDFESSASDLVQNLDTAAAESIESEAPELETILEEFSEDTLPTNSSGLADLASEFLEAAMSDAATSQDLATEFVNQMTGQSESIDASNLADESTTEIDSSIEIVSEVANSAPEQPAANAQTVPNIPSVTSEARTPTYVNTEATRNPEARPTLGNRYIVEQGNGQTHSTTPAARTPINRYRTSSTPAPQYIAPPRVKNRYTNQ